MVKIDSVDFFMVLDLVKVNFSVCFAYIYLLRRVYFFMQITEIYFLIYCFKFAVELVLHYQAKSAD